MDTLGKRLEQIRAARGLSRDALAILTNLSFEGIRRIETGIVLHPRFDTIQALAKALDISLDVLTAPEIEVSIYARS